MKYKNTGTETLIFDNDGKERALAPGASAELAPDPYVRGLLARGLVAEVPAKTPAAGPTESATAPKDVADSK